MKKVPLLLTIALAAVLTACNCNSSSEAQMGALDAIMTRTSVRAYTAEPVDQAQVETILKATMAAPTAGNKQPWEDVVINDPEILAKIPTIIKSAKMAANAPLAIVSCGVPSKSIPNMQEYWVQDVSASNENMLLAAHAIGLGAVWCGVYPDNGGRIAKMQKLLNLPADVIPLSVTVIGHPSSETQPKDKWAPEKVSYNKYGSR